MELFKSYGEQFHDAINTLNSAIHCEESPLPETLKNLMMIPMHLLNKYPLAIRRIIKALWSDIEIYLNYFYRHGGEKDNEELFINAIAQLERLEEEFK